MPDVYLALGSNVEPERHLERAFSLLRGEFPALRVSGWYRNRAAGFEGENFINAVAGMETPLTLGELLPRLHAIEAACGRARDAPKWAPRSMDIDVMLYGDVICDGPLAVLPRPDLLRRAYMLGPLAEIAPDLRHPTAGITMAELWARFDQGAHPLERLGARG